MQLRYNSTMFLDEIPDIEEVRFASQRRSQEKRAKNYVIYCRRSQESDDTKSIPAQLAHCLDFAKREGLNVIGLVQEQKSARSKGRAKFTNLMRAIRGEEELKYLDLL